MNEDLEKLLREVHDLLMRLVHTPSYSLPYAIPKLAEEADALIYKLEEKLNAC